MQVFPVSKRARRTGKRTGLGATPAVAAAAAAARCFGLAKPHPPRTQISLLMLQVSRIEETVQEVIKILFS